MKNWSNVQCSSQTCEHHSKRVGTKVWVCSQTRSVNAITVFTFAECVCFCLDSLWYVVFCSSHETKRHFCFTTFFGDVTLPLIYMFERIDVASDKFCVMVSYYESVIDETLKHKWMQTEETTATWYWTLLPFRSWKELWKKCKRQPMIIFV